jgi:hypothetical protein
MRKAAILFGLLALVSPPVVADVPPDAGYVRQSSNLILESSEDLSGYGFFLESPMKVEEIKIAKGTPTVVEASARVGAMRFGKLLAIPAGEIEQFRDRLSEEEFREALKEKKLFTATQLLSHNFQTTIPEGADWQDPVYRIEKDRETGLRAVQISGGTSTGGSRGPLSSGLRFWGSAAAAIVAGIFLLFGIAMLGILYFRRSSKHP